MKNFIIASLLLLSVVGCKDDGDVSNLPISNVIVVNAVQDIANLKINSSTAKGQFYYSGTTDQLSNGSGRFWYVPTGAKTLIAVNALDTTKILFNNITSLNGKVYSLFLCGTSNTPDAILKEETNFPVVKTDVGVPASADSVLRIRFVNLAMGSPELKVTLATSPTVNEITSLKYKDVTDWKPYSARIGGPASYAFQIRRADDNTLLVSRSVTVSATSRFKNISIVVKGIIGGLAPNAFAANVVNYF